MQRSKLYNTCICMFLNDISSLLSNQESQNQLIHFCLKTKMFAIQSQSSLKENRSVLCNISEWKLGISGNV